ncbi:hypothetical protein A3C98_00455 [Candidatus Roizmanbacteria bacterium RIFCSPHIGHO2_02_FULL_37_15]|uniref:NAD-dependent epimerase/dehydratase domain-containing protein n=1 Tax=Candidatus Roizmanbacteria bacterium RIFCSPLOWO2_01_FULL_37_16 TaxID=1802058 RepID=A0A1F7IQU2_9BACT|nr:MAG: hypothetical protein A2859_02630 [Candidatus Roizmanbacteria bacterium RIFCSPHIGHO2_01_FULL_37_16b]OGK22205.1 MAG: hypothetical protein A3C98_00455 [Candidatus Roizmanbacteria bacterium RIFCSPHIGHO2_02_FULL_37_15]OGK33239.1 MAG: hypothetical protein A3F57_03060 [Candidatus Roizmanbacteria bacterium RIFCSPHIGHO2_12_FULL_36_11]OGK45730.1 MAG: hypothetical protein A3B40_05590 [Candidatus Roizmanbacteria bacterium RIFCSPLOWO2_01_FULL_37_16]OGK56385.1 MAG: hypothetical protein A3I50_00850 [C
MINFKNRNILVTGGTGFVGSHLVEELVMQEANVVTTFISTNPLSYFFSQKLNKKVRMAHVDVRDFESVFDLVTKNDIEYIFHLAAQALVETAYYNPKKTMESNIMGTVNILESARLFPKVKAVVVASSDKAYGKLDYQTLRVKKAKYFETDPLKGDHPYEVSKSAADLIAYSYFKTYNLPVVITRFGNIYGEGDLNFSRIIPDIMRAIIKKEKLEIRSDGTYVRDYLYVKDVVDGYLRLANKIEKVRGEAFNFGSRESLSVIELIKSIERILKKKINYKILNTAKNEIPYQSLNYLKIKRKLDWQPKYNLVKSIEKIYKWYKKIL